MGVALAVGRRDGLSGDRFAFYAALHFASPRRRVLAPEGIPVPHSGVGVLEAPVRRVLRSGLVELDDGCFCLIASAAGTSFALRSDEEQAGLVDAFARFLNGLTEPVQIAVRAEPLDLRARAGALETSAQALPHPALAQAAREHARFLAQFADGEGVRRREILLVLATRQRERDAAANALLRRAGEASELLGGAGVTVAILDGEHVAALLAGSFDPPGTPTGSSLEGTVHAC